MAVTPVVISDDRAGGGGDWCIASNEEFPSSAAISGVMPFEAAMVAYKFLLWFVTPAGSDLDVYWLRLLHSKHLSSELLDFLRCVLLRRWQGCLLLHFKCFLYLLMGVVYL